MCDFLKYIYQYFVLRFFWYCRRRNSTLVAKECADCGNMSCGSVAAALDGDPGLPHTALARARMPVHNLQKFSSNAPIKVNTENRVERKGESISRRPNRDGRRNGREETSGCMFQTMPDVYASCKAVQTCFAEIPIYDYTFRLARTLSPLLRTRYNVGSCRSRWFRTVYGVRLFDLSDCQTGTLALV